MSDLQCPATFLLLPGPSAPAGTSEPLGELARALAGEHVAEVVSGPGASSGALADVLAAELGVRRADLDDGASAAGTRWGPVPALEEVADLHRGERVVVVLAAADLEAVLQVARRSPASPPTRAPGGWTEVAVDADGWVLRATP